jgi:hypothetical protein
VEVVARLVVEVVEVVVEVGNSFLHKPVQKISKKNSATPERSAGAKRRRSVSFKMNSDFVV